MTTTDISDRRLLELQADALFTHDADGRMRCTNEPNGGPAPRFFFGHTREGNLWRFRYNVADDMVQRLEELAAHEPVVGDLRIEPRLLATFQLAFGESGEPEHYGPAYRFLDEPKTPSYATRITPANVHLIEAMGEGWEGFGQELEWREPCCAVIENNIAVSVCFSARLTQFVAEAGVATLPEYRGRGHASSAVSTWACAIRAMNRTPLYSTSWENAASQSVARKLGLIQYAVNLSL